MTVPAVRESRVSRGRTGVLNMSQSFCSRCGMSLDNPREEKTGRHQEYQRCIELLKGHLDRLFTIAHKCKTALDALSDLIAWEHELPSGFRMTGGQRDNLDLIIIKAKELTT